MPRYMREHALTMPLKILKHRKGQALVEFSILLPILLVIMGIIITGAQILYAQLTLNMASYEAARQGIVQSNVSEANRIAKQTAQNFVSPLPMLDKNQLTFSGKVSGSWVRSSSYHVHLEHPIKVFFPIPGLTDFKIGQTHIIKADAVLAVEYRP